MPKYKPEDFQGILDSLYLFTARPNSIQRITFYGGHVLNNRYNPVKYVLNMPVSETDEEWYYEKESADRFFTKEAEEFLKPGFLEEYRKRDMEYFVTWFALCDEMHEHFTNFEKYTADQTLNLVKRYYAYPFRDDTCFYFGMSVWSFEQKVVPEFEKILKGYFGGKYEDAWRVITAPTELSDEQTFRIRLAILKKKYGSDLPESDLAAMQQEYRYLGIYCPEDYGFDEEYVHKAYRNLNIQETLKITSELAKNDKRLKALRASCKKDKRILEIIALSNFNVNFRNRRSEKISFGFASLTPFYDFLIQQTSLSRMQVGNVTRDEVIAYFEQGTPLPKRIGHPGMLYTGKMSYELDAKEKELFEKKFRSFAAVDEITGKTAHPGVVRGPVKVIQSMNELDKVKEGDVLVSQFTRPEFMAAMKKALAIVTNDGGITCHAAIVSRELKIPCIIGTKIATKVLHDGDEVEVDATKGVVRIIKRA